MPASEIIKTGDMIQITAPPPVVVPSIVSPLPLVGSSADHTVMNMPVCLEGDELPKMLLSPQPYTQASFTIPGTIMVSVKLMPGNKTMMSKNGKPILTKGTPFISEFQVVSPAMQPNPPAPPVPDPVLKKPPGKAEFITTNMTVTAG